MVDIPDEVLCLFHATVEEREDSYVLEVPKREITEGAVQRDTVHRVALFPAASTDRDDAALDQKRSREHDQADGRESDRLGPPVADGDERTVDIEDIGEQGDGIARVERGYVIIVPDTEKGERVTVEITDVTETVGFGEVVSRADYYE